MTETATGQPMASLPTLAWAILGTGAVAAQFASALPKAGGQLVAVASRRADRAEAFAVRFGSRATSYEDAIADPAVRAVYIATPPATHEALACAAMAAGKAALVEKPFASDAAAAARIRDAARAAGTFCMEAMWTRFQPLIGDLRRRIEAGEIGAPRQFEAEFCVANLPDPATSLFDPVRGGGALLHRGIYGLSLARFLLGPVTGVRSMARIGPTGVDEDCILTLRHASGALSDVRASLRAGGPGGMSIRGETGSILVAPPLYRPPGAWLQATSARSGGTGAGAAGLRNIPLVHRLWQRAGPVMNAMAPRGRRLHHPYSGNGYGHQIAAVATALAEGRHESPLMPLDESVEILALADAARAQWHQDGDPAP